MAVQVVKTDKGFGLMVNGQVKPIPIGYMRVSEMKPLESLINDAIKSESNNPASPE